MLNQYILISQIDILTYIQLLYFQYSATHVPPFEAQIKYVLPTNWKGDLTVIGFYTTYTINLTTFPQKYHEGWVRQQLKHSFGGKMPFNEELSCNNL